MAQQNGFKQFVEHWRKSKNFKISFPSAVEACGKIWKDMTEEQRCPFIASAKEANIKISIERDLMKCKAILVSNKKKEEIDASREVKLMQNTIENILMQAKNLKDLEDMQFVFVAFNYFSKTLANDVYLPAEFAACQFSLKDGLISLYSSHINPDTSIMGQSSEAVHHASATHQLPLPPDALGEKNLSKLNENIIEYLQKIQPNQKPIVVYTAAHLVPVVKACLKYLACHAKQSNIINLIHIADIQYLFYALKRHICNMLGIENDTIKKPITDAYFAIDYFEYQSGIACEFHDNLDRGQYCVESLVKRWCYTFSKYMSNDLAIPQVAGKHMPLPSYPSNKEKYLNDSGCKPEK